MENRELVCMISLCMDTTFVQAQGAFRVNPNAGWERLENAMHAYQCWRNLDKEEEQEFAESVRDDPIHAWVDKLAAKNRDKLRAGFTLNEELREDWPVVKAKKVRRR
jgi:wobble nucleotide-excising tRNase